MDANVMHIFGFVIKPIHVSVFYLNVWRIIGGVFMTAGIVLISRW